jgi:hypothetical protein
VIFQSGRGLPQSETLRDAQRSQRARQRPGLRQPSGAFLPIITQAEASKTSSLHNEIHPTQLSQSKTSSKMLCCNHPVQNPTRFYWLTMTVNIRHQDLTTLFRFIFKRLKTHRRFSCHKLIHGMSTA